MSDDVSSVVTNESWFSRLGNSIKSVLAGILLFVVSFPLLWWNEGRAVKTAKSLHELGETVVSVASADKVLPENENKPVHMTAEATTAETLADPDFPVALVAIKLRRTAQMYQWTEHEETKTEKKLGGGTQTVKTYSYREEWADRPVDSGKFHTPAGHANPGAMRYRGAEEVARKVRFGAFTLAAGLVGQMNDFEALPFASASLEKLPDDLRKAAEVDAGTIYLPNEPKGEKPDPHKPKIGDLRISFAVVKPATVSIIARQAADSFGPWQSSVAGSPPVERLMVGAHDAKAMVGEMEHENSVLTWVLRLVGFLLMAFGIGMVFGPLAVLADVLPIAGDLLRGGIAIFAGVVAASLSLLTIAAAWIYYRPWLAVALIFVAVAIVFLLKTFGRKRAAAAAT